MKVRYLLPAMLLTASCTPQQIDAWVQWHNTDPVAAEEFANSPEIQAQLHPAPVAQSNANSIGSYNPRWDRIARCESGGNWSYHPVTNRTGTYSGGLMIWQKAWVQFHGTDFAPWAYQASKLEQIVVAERIRASQGWGAWDCA